jgi:hypothetical protein
MSGKAPGQTWTEIRGYKDLQVWQKSTEDAGGPSPEANH